MTESLPASQTYPDLLATLTARIREARLRAAVSVIRELILLYWEMGATFCSGSPRKGGAPLSSIAWPATCAETFLT